MARWAPARADVIADYAREILDVHRRGRIVIGIDGIEWPGPARTRSSRESFAADLAEALSRVGVPGRAVTADADDLDGFRRDVLQPYRAQALDRAALVVSGAFLHTGDWAGIWHTSAWIQVSRAVARARDAERAVAEPALADWYDEVETVFRRVDARTLANATFDLTDPAHPRREFEDAC